jgi:16S rRNA (guanine527-N7)-methyltransferase
VQFEEELARVLPPDVPHRDRLIEQGAQHLALVASANEQMNLTRITTPDQAAIKHVYDSVAPWQYFRRAKCVLDAGTGAGFPGIPLAIVLPDVKFMLSESIQKKARFVESVVDSLELPNVRVVAERAEEAALRIRPEVITARAIAPLSRILELFASAMKRGSTLILYKGPEVVSELSDAKNLRFLAEILCQYELPDGLGTRTLVRIRSQPRPARVAS